MNKKYSQLNYLKDLVKNISRYRTASKALYTGIKMTAMKKNLHSFKDDKSIKLKNLELIL
jgi:hypothetical protein